MLIILDKKQENSLIKNLDLAHGRPKTNRGKQNEKDKYKGNVKLFDVFSFDLTLERITVV